MKLPVLVKITALGISVICTVSLSSPASAALPQLRISPLKYQQHLEVGRPQTGIFDVSNPTGSPLQIRIEVQAFRQANDRGELEFYDDERLAAAVTPASREFRLGPREAIRTQFTIDPSKLGEGGAYGAIFARTVPAKGAGSDIQTSARVGTLLLLDVGGGGTKSGHVSRLNLPRFTIGAPRFDAPYAYANTGKGPQALAFAPQLQAKVGLWGKPQKLTGPFVFPGRARQAQAVLTSGAHVGLVPVTLTDLSTGSSQVRSWAIMLTGFWTWLLPLLLVIILIALSPVVWWRRLHRRLRRRFRPLIRRWRRRYRRLRRWLRRV